MENLSSSLSPNSHSSSSNSHSSLLCSPSLPSQFPLLCTVAPATPSRISGSEFLEGSEKRETVPSRSAVYRNVWSRDGFPQFPEGIRDCDSVFRRSVRQFPDHECLGWRPILNAEELLMPKAVTADSEKVETLRGGEVGMGGRTREEEKRDEVKEEEEKIKKKNNSEATEKAKVKMPEEQEKKNERKHKNAKAEEVKKKFGEYNWLSYKEVNVLIHILSYGMRELLGLKAGDRIGLYGINAPPYMLTILACQRCGIVPVPLYDSLGEGAVQFILSDAKVTTVFVSNEKLPALLQAVANVKTLQGGEGGEREGVKTMGIDHSTSDNGGSSSSNINISNNDEVNGNINIDNSDGSSSNVNNNTKNGLKSDNASNDPPPNKKPCFTFVCWTEFCAQNLRSKILDPFVEFQSGGSSQAAVAPRSRVLLHPHPTEAVGVERAERGARDEDSEMKRGKKDPEEETLNKVKRPADENVWRETTQSDALLEFLGVMSTAAERCARSGVFGSEHGASDPESPAVIMYTSGTTGDPKGVVLSHRSLTAAAASLQLTLSVLNVKVGRGDSFLSYLPLAHILDYLSEFVVLSLGGGVGYFQGDLRGTNLQSDIQALRPTILPAVPRVLHRISEGIRSTLRKKPVAAQTVFNAGFALKKAMLQVRARRLAEHRQQLRHCLSLMEDVGGIGGVGGMDGMDGMGGGGGGGGMERQGKERKGNAKEEGWLKTRLATSTHPLTPTPTPPTPTPLTPPHPSTPTWLETLAVALCLLCEVTIFAVVRKRLGGRLRIIISGGAPLAPSTETFLRVALSGYPNAETAKALDLCSGPLLLEGRLWDFFEAQTQGGEGKGGGRKAKNEMEKANGKETGEKTETEKRIEKKANVENLEITKNSKTSNNNGKHKKTNYVKELGDRITQSIYGPEIVQGYGLTESCGASFMQLNGRDDPGQADCVGPPQPGTEFCLESVPEMGYDATPEFGLQKRGVGSRSSLEYGNHLADSNCRTSQGSRTSKNGPDGLADPYLDLDSESALEPKGELLIRGPLLFSEYLNRADLTSEAMTSDGWFRTGDICRLFGSGSLQIVDRKKNLFKTGQGEYISPEKLECVYEECASLAQVWVYGNSLKNFPVAVAVPEPETFLNMAADLGLLESKMKFKNVAPADDSDSNGSDPVSRHPANQSAAIAVLDPTTEAAAASGPGSDELRRKLREKEGGRSSQGVGLEPHGNEGGGGEGGTDHGKTKEQEDSDKARKERKESKGGKSHPSASYIDSLSEQQKQEIVKQLCRNPKMTEKILEELVALARSKKLRGFEIVKGLILEPEPWIVANGFATPTLKLKRPALQQHFQKEIERMYDRIEAAMEAKEER